MQLIDLSEWSLIPGLLFGSTIGALLVNCNMEHTDDDRQETISIEDQSSTPATTRERPQIKQAIGGLVTALWFAFLIYGFDPKWLKQIPNLWHFLLLLGLLFSTHLLMPNVTLGLNKGIRLSLQKSGHSNWWRLIHTLGCTLLGGAVGWMLTIKHSTAALAACSAVFGAALMGLFGFLTTGQLRTAKHERIEPNDTH